MAFNEFWWMIKGRFQNGQNLQELLGEYSVPDGKTRTKSSEMNNWVWDHGSSQIKKLIKSQAVGPIQTGTVIFSSPLL